MIYLYHIVDANGRVRYVGRSHNSYNRMRHHLSLRKDGFGPLLSQWLNELWNAGIIPDVRPVAAYPDEGSAHAAETEEIMRQLELGSPLLNRMYKGTDAYEKDVSRQWHHWNQ